MSRHRQAPRKKQPVDVLTALVLREIKSMKPSPNRLLQLARWLQADQYIVPADRVELSHVTITQLTELALDCIQTTGSAVFAVYSVTELVKFLTKKQVTELEEQIDRMYNKHFGY